MVDFGLRLQEPSREATQENRRANDTYYIVIVVFYIVNSCAPGSLPNHWAGAPRRRPVTLDLLGLTKSAGVCDVAWRAGLRAARAEGASLTFRRIDRLKPRTAAARRPHYHGAVLAEPFDIFQSQSG